MAELSHRVLRELIESFGGCTEYFTEMISAAGLLSGGPFEAWYLDGGPRPEKIVYQLEGASACKIASAAAVLDRLPSAGIDINMGCSAPLVRKAGAGVAWMSSIDKAGDLVAKVRKATKKRLSVKIRAGFTGDFEYLLRFCRRLEEEGTELVTLHPRTAGEKFRRTARWDYVYRLRKELRIPVAGNGDISDAAELAKRAAFDNGDRACDGDRASGGLMVGRAAVREPWIFARARRFETGTELRPDALSREGPFPAETETPPVEETGLRFLDLLARYQPPEFHLSRARRFFGYFCGNLVWGNYVINRINREEDLAGIERVWRNHFEEHPEERAGKYFRSLNFFSSGSSPTAPCPENGAR
ncbi:MAG: tRNA-dihydrouridine synthase family protein [Treponema sp.]|jgi:tRNA-dihydrouridine synthase|nr:tRNA-dihydrouridine synthase family protein [Treponema sp.]